VIFKLGYCDSTFDVVNMLYNDDNVLS